MRTLRTVLAVAVLPALLVAGCGGDDESDGTLPPADDQSSSTASNAPGKDDDNGTGGTEPANDPRYAPKPKGAKLSAGEQAAYKKALRDYDRWHAIAERLNRNPRTTKAVQRKIINHTYSPYTATFYKKVALLKQKGLTEEGRATRPWRVPVSVELDKNHPTVTILECIDTSSLRVLRDGTPIDPEVADPFRSRTTLTADEAGLWRPTKSANGASCAG
ncbi:hypothetical protein [Solicola gregarius]|uniref:Lipoprotein n=1 Tax=Solicola gregarius TaxID=2908642 RepID=A0AA46TKX8_9ACTN|nr:hypothetical protein [Solicola gregarius]UYM06323.1 hypothetical protein L0C25_04385 [Solicola gregarius]